MRVEIQIRITCDGWQCRKKNGKQSVFEGFIPVEFMGNDNIIMLPKVTPEGWIEKHLPDAFQPSYYCPDCKGFWKP